MYYSAYSVLYSKKKNRQNFLAEQMFNLCQPVFLVLILAYLASVWMDSATRLSINLNEALENLINYWLWRVEKCCA
jgi:hypothetical protein